MPNLYNEAIPYNTTAEYEGGGRFGQALPAWKVEVAFANNPYDTSPTWTDISTYVLSVQTDRGRQHELNRIQPGTASIVLTNNDGRFSPWNSQSPYYNSGTGLMPMKPVRISGTYAGTNYPIYRGFIESFPIDWKDVSSTDVTLKCVDAMSLLAQVELSSTGYAQAVIADGPTAYWRMDETTAATVTADSSGNGNNAVPTNVTFGADSALVADTGNSYDFGHASAGTGGYLTPPSSLVVSANSQPFTIETWALIPDLPVIGVDNVYIAEQAVPAGVVTTGTVHDWYIFVDPSGNVNFLVGNNKVTAQVHTTNIADNAVHHIVCEYIYVSANSYTLSVTIDNVAQSTTYTLTALPTFTAAPGSFLVGGIAPSNARMWGRLDEFAIYKNVALSTSRVSVHYHLGHDPWSGDSTGTRIGRVLDLIGWPTALRSLDTGNSTLQGPMSPLNTNAADYLQTLMDTENGVVYVDTSGNVVFHQRQRVLTGSYTVSQVTLGDGTSEEPYEADGTAIGLDLLDTYNDAQITRTGGDLQQASDSASQTSYGKRSYVKTELLMTTDAEARDYAYWIIGRYKTPIVRISSIKGHPVADPINMCPQGLGRDLQDRVTVKRRQFGSVDVFSQQSNIEGIEHNIDGQSGDWNFVWRLSPADATSYWVLDSSALGTGTRLAY